MATIVPTAQDESAFHSAPAIRGPLLRQRRESARRHRQMSSPLLSRMGWDTGGR
jgi:hypothetical protein